MAANGSNGRNGGAAAAAHTASETAEVCIVGVGIAGISVACRLRKAGVGPLVAFEKGAEVGGTWSVNCYPGAACDVPAHLYSLSFSYDFDWRRNFATQAELLAYLKRIVETHKLLEPGATGSQAGKPIVRLSTEVTEARWDGAGQRWVVRAVNNVTGESTVVHARFLVVCLGRMAFPVYPDIKGAEAFAGPTVHTAQWREDVDLKGKRVAVIGTGASAVQVIPAIAGEVSHLTVFQRSPPHVLPKPDYAFSGLSRFLLRLKYLPIAHMLFRNHLFWTHECFHGIFADSRRSSVAKIARAIAAHHLKKQIKDPELRAQLTPTYPMGCRRILLSNTYYPALARPTTTVVTSGIQCIKPAPSLPPAAELDEETKDERQQQQQSHQPAGGGGGVIVDGEGKEYPVDVIVYATGFRVRDAMEQVKAVGLDGMDLQERYRAEGWSSYLGIATKGMPNFLMTMGSHTSLGHNSMIAMMECQTNYIVSFIKQMRKANAAVATLKPELEDAFMQEMTRRLDRSVWQAGSCDSYYITGQPADKTRPASDLTWPGTVVEYWRRTRRADLRRQFDVWGADGGRLW